MFCEPGKRSHKDANWRMLNVHNLLYRPSLILLSRTDHASENSLDLSTTLTCARFCVVSAKDTIQLLHGTTPALTGVFWHNIFCTAPSQMWLIQLSTLQQRSYLVPVSVWTTGILTASMKIGPERLIT